MDQTKEEFLWEKEMHDDNEGFSWPKPEKPIVVV